MFSFGLPTLFPSSRPANFFSASEFLSQLLSTPRSMREGIDPRSVIAESAEEVYEISVVKVGGCLVVDKAVDFSSD